MADNKNEITATTAIMAASNLADNAATTQSQSQTLHELYHHQFLLSPHYPPTLSFTHTLPQYSCLFPLVAASVAGLFCASPCSLLFRQVNVVRALHFKYPVL